MYGLFYVCGPRIPRSSSAGTRACTPSPGPTWPVQSPSGRKIVDQSLSFRYLLYIAHAQSQSYHITPEYKQRTLALHSMPHNIIPSDHLIHWRGQYQFFHLVVLGAGFAAQHVEQFGALDALRSINAALIQFIEQRTR